MNSTLTSSNSQPQAVFIGKERNFAPVNRTVVDYPLVIDAQFDSQIDALSGAKDSTNKPDQTQFIPTYDKQQQLQNLTYSANGEFSALQQDIIEAPKASVLSEPATPILGTSIVNNRLGQPIAPAPFTQRQAIDAFQYIEAALNGAPANKPPLSVDTFA